MLESGDAPLLDRVKPLVDHLQNLEFRHLQVEKSGCIQEENGAVGGTDYRNSCELIALNIVGDAFQGIFGYLQRRIWA